jgi:hypothetical protein
VCALVRACGRLTLADLLLQPTGATADDLYILIAPQQIQVDLHAAPLAEPRHVSRSSAGTGYALAHGCVRLR